jgi:lipopolysaccharide/colanic/teichoic acid biosynthesis glycosyltransferase
MTNSYRKLKRLLDVVGALFCLLLFWPLMLLIALLVRVNLGSPVLFRQERPGLEGKLFMLYKFRSMKKIDEVHGITYDADRLGSFGRLLRSTSLDELPSLWNVLRGEMSFVGPRPLLVEYLSMYNSKEAKRHQVRPGITGLAQVSGRNSISWNEKLEMDIKYLENVSLLLDIRILFRTIGVTLKREGINAKGHVTSPKFTRNDDRPKLTNDI